jgi:pyridoxal phosphate enzyme (YggS family)
MITAAEKRYDNVLERVEKARTATNEHTIVKIIAVSKYVESNAVDELYQTGQRAFGENRVQDLIQKRADLDHLPLEWHFIGRLQKNKINHLIDQSPALIHSIDSLQLAQEIDKRLALKGKQTNALLQINSSYEASKSGIDPHKAIDEYQQIAQTCPNITLKGVMTIGAHSEEERAVQDSFTKTYAIFEALKKDGAKYCSMGMSGDFELAIRCGSNMLRLGSILF